MPESIERRTLPIVIVRGGRQRCAVEGTSEVAAVAADQLCARLRMHTYGLVADSVATGVQAGDGAVPEEVRVTVELLHVMGDGTQVGIDRPSPHGSLVGGGRPFGCLHHHPCVGQVDDAAGVVEVDVGQHDGADVRCMGPGQAQRRGQ